VFLIATRKYYHQVKTNEAYHILINLRGESLKSDPLFRVIGTFSTSFLNSEHHRGLRGFNDHGRSSFNHISRKQLLMTTSRVFAIRTNFIRGKAARMHDSTTVSLLYMLGYRGGSRSRAKLAAYAPCHS